MAKQQLRPKRKRLDSPFAKNLAKVLKERAVSQRAAAELAGVPVSVVNDWLAGAVPHDLTAVQKICRSLKIEFEWVLTGERSNLNMTDVPLSEIFDFNDEPDFSGFFEISARRLKRKGGNGD